MYVLKNEGRVYDYEEIKAVSKLKEMNNLRVKNELEFSPSMAR